MKSYEQKYKEALEVAKRKLCFDKAGMVDSFTPNDIYEMFPELKESEDEKIRKELIGFLRNIPNHNYTCEEMALWLEKQGGITKLSDEEQNKFAKGVLTSCALSFIDYLDAHKYEDKMCVSNGECEDIENAFHNAMWDRLHRYYCKYIEKQGEQNLANSAKTCKVEPKFKVKYAGSEYNVFETKNIAGVTYYGIEDEPNHIDYVQAENCERVDGYSIKESGSPFPTKPAKFSEQNSTWGEEDEGILDEIIDFLENGTVKLQHDLSLYASWLKSLKDRYAWRPSWEQLDALEYHLKHTNENSRLYKETKELYDQLKKL